MSVTYMEFDKCSSCDSHNLKGLPVRCGLIGCASLKWIASLGDTGDVSLVFLPSVLKYVADGHNIVASSDIRKNTKGCVLILSDPV